MFSTVLFKLVRADSKKDELTAKMLKICEEVKIYHSRIGVIGRAWKRVFGGDLK